MASRQYSAMLRTAASRAVGALSETSVEYLRD